MVGREPSRAVGERDQAEAPGRTPAVDAHPRTVRSAPASDPASTATVQPGYAADMFADAIGAGLHAESAYGTGDPPAASSHAQAGPSGSVHAAREDFEVQNWTAGRNTSLVSGALRGMEIGVSSGGIHASAEVRALTPQAQGYSTGYLQTMHHSTRRAVYTDGSGAVVNAYVASRGTVMDQRTDLGSPVPWYNFGVHLGSAARQPGMTDNPTWVIPTYSPEYGTPARMEGSESFTTYLVTMVGNDSSTIIYLGNVRWNVNWQGRFDAGMHFHGHDANIGATTSSAAGGAVTAGPAANTGSMGAFEHGGDAAAGGDASTHGGGATSFFGGEEDEEHLRELRGAIEASWLPLLVTAETDTSAPGLARWKAVVYRRLVTEPAAPSTLPAVVAYLGADPTKAGLATAASSAREFSGADRPRIANLHTATNRFIGSGSATEASAVFMTEYPSISSLGRAYINGHPQPLPWVTSLETYSHASAERDGERIAVGGGRARTSNARALLAILHEQGPGVFETAPDSVVVPAAADGAASPRAPQPGDPDYPLTPDQQAEFDRLRHRIIALCPEPSAGHRPTAVDHEQLRTLTTDLRAADPAVKDRLTADVELTRRMQSGLTGWNMESLTAAMDSVQGLLEAVRAILPEGQTRFGLIRDYLAARAGTGPDDVPAREARMRVMNNAELGAIIARLPAREHQDLVRLASRGTLVPDPIDAVYDAARGSREATDALRGLMQLASNRTRLDALQADPLFRDAIQHLTTPVTVDGLTCSPFDYTMRLWGLDPRETTDPAAPRAGEVNPNPGDVTPLEPSDWRAIDVLFAATVERLAARLARPSVLLFTDSWTSDSAVISILTTFENECAADPMRDLLRRGHIVPGQELTQRANADARIGDIRERLHRCVGDDGRQICERILSIRIDAASVGLIGGAVRTAADGVGAADGTRHVPIEQALREVTIGGVTLTQSARTCADAIAESLATHWYRATRRDPDEINRAWHAYRAGFTPEKKEELSQLTGVAAIDIHAIEFLVNTFREVPNGGDLATRITNCVVEDRVGDTLLDFGLTASQVSERAVRHGEAPPEATPADRFGPAATQLWQAIGRVGTHATEAFSPAPLETVARLYTTGTSVTGPSGAAAPEHPRMVAGTLPGTLAPARVDGAADAPATFASFYRATYGIDPDRHVIELGRSFLTAAAQRRNELLHPEGARDRPRTPTDEERATAETWNLTAARVAGFLHVDPAQFSAAVTAPAARAEVTDANSADLPVGYRAEDAETSARAIWNQLQGAGDVVLIREQINARRPEELRLINIEFRRLSGGIDVAFYLRQAAERTSLAVGGDGVREGGLAAAEHAPHVHGDTGSMIETADLAQSGRVAILTRMRNAIARSDRSELYRVVGDATSEEKRQILGDAATMDSLRQQLSAVEFDRVFADLNGTLDLAGMLWSRSSEASWRGAADVEGMRSDIRSYIERRREFHTRELDRGGEVDQDEVQRRVREDALRAYSNPSVRTVIETECRSLFLSGPNSDASSLEGTIINAGTDPHTGALTGNNWANVSELLTGIRAMEPAPRAAWRNDPEFWLRVDALSPSDSQRREIIAALNGTEASGSDHLGTIRSGLDGGTGDVEIQEALAHLSAEEVQRLQADPALVARLQSRFAYSDGARGVLAALLGTRHGRDAAAAVGAYERRDADGHLILDASGLPTYGLTDVTGTLPTSEVDRLAALEASAIARMRYGTDRSWDQLLREAVEVYRMDFHPHASAAPAAAGAPPAPATPEPRRAADIAGRRAAVWHAVRELIRPQANDEAKHQIIEDAVMGRQDPSATLARRFLGGDDSESEIEATIRGASPDLIVDSWSSVAHLKYAGTDGGNDSYRRVYRRYRDLRDAGAPGGDLETARLAFQRYRIEPSVQFESLLLSYAGNDTFDGLTGTPEARRARTSRDGELHRDNPEWHRWRDLLLERIGGLSVDDKLRGIDAEGDADARAIVGGRLASAEQRFLRAEEDHAFSRGDGYSFFGDEHGRELDRAFGDYGTALGEGEDRVRHTEAETGAAADLSATEAGALGGLDARYTERSAEYTQAREEAAHWAGLVVAAVIGAAVTALTAGAGSVAMVAMYGALTGAAAATGEALTHEMILGRTYDGSGEGLRNIAQGAVTGMVTAGAQFYAGSIIRSLSGLAPEAGTALQQAERMAGVAEETAPGWRSMLQQAGRAGVTAGVATGLTGFANAAGTLINPSTWMQGWDEGWVRAQQRIGAELRAIPLNVLRTSVAAMLANIHVPGGEEAGHAVAAGERIGVETVLAEIASQLPTNLRQGVIEAALRGGGAREMAVAAGESTLGGVRDVGLGLHDGSATRAVAGRFAQREILAHATEFANGSEVEHYVRTVIDGHQIGAREFLAARETVARAYMNGSGAPLTEAQERAFIRWCREAPSAEEFRERMRTNPADVEAVRTAGAPVPVVATPVTVDPESPAAQARTHATTAETAAGGARGSAESALRAEDAYHAGRSAETGQRAIAEILAAERSVAEHVATAQRAVQALEGMLNAAAAEHRAAIEAELASARESLRVATSQQTLIDLTLRAVRDDVATLPPDETPPSPEGEDPTREVSRDAEHAVTPIDGALARPTEAEAARRAVMERYMDLTAADFTGVEDPRLMEISEAARAENSEVQARLRAALARAGITDVQVQARAKSPQSILGKLQETPGMTVRQIRDLSGVRVNIINVREGGFAQYDRIRAVIQEEFGIADTAVKDYNAHPNPWGYTGRVHMFSIGGADIFSEIQVGSADLSRFIERRFSRPDGTTVELHDLTGYKGELYGRPVPAELQSEYTRLIGVITRVNEDGRNLADDPAGAEVEAYFARVQAFLDAPP